MLPGIPLEYYYPIFSVLMFTLAYLLIPKQKFRNLFWYGLIWGFLGSILYSVILGTLLQLLRYEHAGPFTFLGSPIWLNMAWIFAVMLYLHYLPEGRAWYLLPLYIFSFSIASAALDMVFNQAGLLEYLNWNPIYRFFLSLLLFYGIKLHRKALAPGLPRKIK